MHLAAQEGYVSLAKILVKYGSQIDSKTKAGYTPLLTACHFGQLNMIHFLLENGASVNATTKLGYTPLHQAAQQGHVSAVSLLLKYKGSPDAITLMGATALSISQRMGYMSVVEILKHVTKTCVPALSENEAYKMASPETMTEDALDSDDEITSVKCNAEDGFKNMQCSDLTFIEKAGQDLFSFETQSGCYSTLSSTRDQLHEELTYMRTSFDHYGNMSSSGKESVLPNENKHILDESVLLSTSQPQGETDNRIKYSCSQISFEPISTIAKKKAQDSSNSLVLHPMNLETAAEKKICRMLVLKPPENENRVSPVSELDPGFSLSTTSLTMTSSSNRQSLYSRFFSSFLVDARGCVMCGYRHPGVRVIFPPDKACMPTCVICKFAKKNSLKMPELNDGEALASRVLQMGPTETDFEGPILIEVPHFASLRGQDREIIILRSDDGDSWYQHEKPETEETIQKVMGESFEALEVAEDLCKRQAARILTTNFPLYFALVTRLHLETKWIGPKGGILHLSQVQAIFPPNSVTNKTHFSLQVLSMDNDFVSKTVDRSIFVSPVVSVEPRGTNFHRPVTISIPFKSTLKDQRKTHESNSQSICLFCKTDGPSMTAWKDITRSISLTLMDDCVSFAIMTPAKFWLLECSNMKESIYSATELYQRAIIVPYMAKFVVFAKRNSFTEGRLRVFCMTDDKFDKTLEKQEHFVEVARSKDVEVLDNIPHFVEVDGNLIPVAKSYQQFSVGFKPFTENRLQILVKIRDINTSPCGKVMFFEEARSDQYLLRKRIPVCVLSIILPDESTSKVQPTEEQTRQGIKREKIITTDNISEFELRLTNIADALQSDWVPLARYIGFTQQEIVKLQMDYRFASEQALVILHMWIETTSNTSKRSQLLQQALRHIERDDIIERCMMSVE